MNLTMDLAMRLGGSEERMQMRTLDEELHLTRSWVVISDSVQEGLQQAQIGNQTSKSPCGNVKCERII